MCRLGRYLYIVIFFKVCCVLTHGFGFIGINDNYGHGVGDIYLQKVAAVLSSIVTRSTDLCALWR